MKIIVLLGLVAAIDCGAITRMLQWSLYKVQYSKNYSNHSEDRRRMDIFFKNKNEIDQHNQRYTMGLVSYKRDLNPYSDLSPKEFEAHMKGLRHSGRKQNITADPPSYFIGLANVKLPKSVDWRKKRAVTAVKEQKHCGSCWAFSVLGSIESQYAIETGHLVSLSVQNLVDCTLGHDREKCDGNSRHEAFDYVKDNGGVDTERSYPYKGVGGSCKYKRRKKARVSLQGVKDIPEGDEKKLQEAIATIGPISVCVDSSHNSFQQYKSGVYYEPKCTDDTDHAVLAVGYGTDDDGQDYYIIKNSWGRDWGEDGYMRIARNRNSHCGIAKEGIAAIIN